MEPVFQTPDFASVSNYPDECRARFMAACAARSAARYHAMKKQHFAEAQEALDDFLLWLQVYGDNA